jgi:hypothetical protein
MARLTGLRSFIVITGIVLIGLRLLHLGVPLVFPNTRSGPIALANLSDVERRAGFAPLIPAYRPAELGNAPTSITVSFNPRPTFAIVWQQGDQFLSVTEWRGSAKPDESPICRPLDGVENSSWWMEGDRAHLILAREGYWVTIVTTLPERDLARLADTLTRY